MGDIFVASVKEHQAPWRRLTTPSQVSRSAASPTGILLVGVVIAPGPMAVTKAPEVSGDFT